MVSDEVQQISQPLHDFKSEARQAPSFLEIEKVVEEDPIADGRLFEEIVR